VIVLESAAEFMDRKRDEFESKKIVKAKDIGRKGWLLFEREAYTFIQQSNLDEKVFLVERLRLKEIIGKAVHPSSKVGNVVYRIAYYIIAKNGKRNGKWAWGQFCPFVPQDDFAKLMDKAKNEGTIIDEFPI